MIPFLYQWQDHKGAAHLKKMTLHPFQGVARCGSRLHTCTRSASTS